MARLVACLACLAGLGPGAPGAPVPTEQPVFYYPTAIGTVLVYAHGEAEFDRVVTAVEDGKDGAKLVTVAQTTPSRVDKLETVSVPAAGLTVVRHRGKALDPPYDLIRPRAKPGDAWPVALPLFPKNRFTATLSGPEEVAVPAGRFRAVRVDLENGNGVGWSAWYAPGVGLVRSGGGGGGAEPVIELKSVTPSTGTLPPATK